jgi:predicted esterase
VRERLNKSVQNGGFPMPGWFDIKALGYSVDSLGTKSVDEDKPGILRSQEYFHGLIQQEIDAGIPSERIILGGFSQGGAMSILSGLTATVKLGGIVGLSSWLLLSQSFKDLVPSSNINKATPVLMCHGDMDPMVRFPLAQDSEKILRDLGYDVTMKVYK